MPSAKDMMQAAAVTPETSRKKTEKPVLLDGAKSCDKQVFDKNKYATLCERYLIPRMGADGRMRRLLDTPSYQSAGKEVNRLIDEERHVEAYELLSQLEASREEGVKNEVAEIIDLTDVNEYEYIHIGVDSAHVNHVAQTGEKKRRSYIKLESPEQKRRVKSEPPAQIKSPEIVHSKIDIKAEQDNTGNDKAKIKSEPDNLENEAETKNQDDSIKVKQEGSEVASSAEANQEGRNGKSKIKSELDDLDNEAETKKQDGSIKVKQEGNEVASSNIAEANQEGHNAKAKIKSESDVLDNEAETKNQDGIIKVKQEGSGSDHKVKQDERIYGGRILLHRQSRKCELTGERRGMMKLGGGNVACDMWWAEEEIRVSHLKLYQRLHNHVDVIV